MPRLQSVDIDTLTPTTRQQLQTITEGGPTAVVYRQLANSDPALSAYLSMEAALRESTRLERLSAREVEAVKLLISELTQCDFCLSIHTAKARRVGLDPALQLAIRRGDAVAETQSAAQSDVRLDCVLRMVRQLFSVPGALPQPLLDEARALGMSDAALVDLCLAYELSRCEEAPSSFIVRIEWTSTKDHLEKFRGSSDFQQFFKHIKSYVEQIEEMRHYTVLDTAVAAEQ